MIPLLDSIFEIHFPLRFIGEKWYFPYITWGLSTGSVAGTVATFLLIREKISASTTSLMISAALILYQIRFIVAISQLSTNRSTSNSNNEI
jgi:membrane-associated HD superfamily phosphohydrolase